MTGKASGVFQTDRNGLSAPIFDVYYQVMLKGWQPFLRQWLYLGKLRFVLLCSCYHFDEDAVDFEEVCRTEYKVGPTLDGLLDAAHSQHM